MKATLTAVAVAASLLAAVMVGRRLRSVLLPDHQGAETRDTIKVAAGLIATMTALLMGLLVSSAKNSYDGTRGQVVQMAARVAYLDWLLAEYGPEAVELRSRVVSAFSVAGAIFLLLELDQPFSGLMRISPEPLLKTLGQIAN